MSEGASFVEETGVHTFSAEEKEELFAIHVFPYLLNESGTSQSSWGEIGMTDATRQGWTSRCRV